MSKTFRHMRQDQANTYSKRRQAREGVWRRGKLEFGQPSRREAVDFVEGNHSAVPPRDVRRGTTWSEGATGRAG